MITPGGRVGDSSPLGHKGKRRVLDDYVRSVAHALMREHGIPKSHAIAIAKNSLKRWAAGGGKVRPQVRAGAAAHLGVQAALDSRHVSLATPIGSSGEGPRVTLAPMAAGRKIRPGSIPAGKGRGKFPITDQKSVKSAASLLHKAKGVSKQTIIAHVRAEAKKRGLKLTPAFKGAKNLATVNGQLVQVVDLVGAKGYSHGWIKAGAPSAPKGGKSRATLPSAPAAGRSKARPPIRVRTAPQRAASWNAASTSMKSRTEAQHAVMRDRAVQMHGPQGGKNYDQLRARAGASKPAAAAAKPTAPVRPISTSIVSNQLRKIGHGAQAKHKAQYTHNGQLVQSSNLSQGFKVTKAYQGVHVRLNYPGMSSTYGPSEMDRARWAAKDAAIKSHFEGLGYTVKVNHVGDFDIQNKP